MKKSNKYNSPDVKNYALRIILSLFILSVMTLTSFGRNDPSSLAEFQPIVISGTVTEENGDPLLGVTVIVKGTTIGTVTDLNGRFTLSIPADAELLLFSYVGMVSQEVEIGDQRIFNIILIAETLGLDEVVVVGYGVQRKESVVGAITQADRETLERRSGSNNLSAALSGQLPGVNIMQRGGEPGRDNPLIYIRGLSTWNEGQPLLLVDGIERGINDIDVGEVESVSVLKDASATAVFGVKGANGVILVTTRRGVVGKTKLSMSANYGIKSISKIYRVMDSYDTHNWINQAIENEVVALESAWDYITPYQEVLYYKKPQQAPYNYLFPNVDWVDEMLNDFASNQRVNMNISGGTDFVKYFGALAYSHEGDLFKAPYNERGYKPGFAYDRFNFRGNLDFRLTKTTDLAVNISGLTGVKREPRFGTTALTDIFHQRSPSDFPVRHEDGFYGKNFKVISRPNVYAQLRESGVQKVNRTQLVTDFKLTQKLDFILKGLSAAANVSYDTYMTGSGPNVLDGGTSGQVLYKAVSKDIIYAETAADSLNYIMYVLQDGTSGRINDFDYQPIPLSYSFENMNEAQYYRALFYQLSLNYSRSFERNEISALALMNRRENAVGAMFPNYREDWVGRMTYNYDRKYFAEVNAAYNGSEKFAPDYRFGFFPSLALGWMLSNEKFLSFDWLSELKLRASIGKVGSDAGIPRWQYLDSWVYQGSTANQGGSTRFGFPLGVPSPYTHYFEDAIANSMLRWETALKKNIGIDMGVLSNQIRLSFDYFVDDREDIFLSAEQRNIPNFFGASPVPSNIGATITKGFELEISFRKRWENGWQFSISESITRATDKITVYEDPELAYSYQKRAGYRIGQSTSQLSNGIFNTWDEAYASASLESNVHRLPGDFHIIDFNADGFINSFDEVPMGYANDRPENTYSTTIGFGYKNLNFLVQFFGVSNVNNMMHITAPWSGLFAVHELLADYWSVDNPGASAPGPRLTTETFVPKGDLWWYDGSYLRLKTLEISYTLPSNWNKFMGIADSRFFVNGNNLFFWSKLPFDMERGNVSQNDPNLHPMFKLINIGVNIDF
jgi:TonB-linked SusC/RagA family outer membrane protein